MNLPDARRGFKELQAKYTWQPEPIEPELTATDALTQTEAPTPNVLADVHRALVELQDNPLVARTDYGPAIVTHPNGRRSWPCGVADVDYWRAAGHTVLDPRVGIVGQPAPFTLPARPRQTFGDVA